MSARSALVLVKRIFLFGRGRKVFEQVRVRIMT
jgi:hypothetical protein